MEKFTYYLRQKPKQPRKKFDSFRSLHPTTENHEVRHCKCQNKLKLISHAKEKFPHQSL